MEENPSDLASLAPPVERCQHLRMPARVEIRFEEEAAAARALRAYSLNFSVGGLCLRTQRDYAVGAPLQVALSVEKMEFRLAATVAWVRPGAVGLRFDEVSEDDRLRLM